MGFRTFSGTMGGGKSYLAAEEALQAFKEGAIVHSNMDWDEEELRKRGFFDQHIKLPENPQDWIKVIKGGAEGKENLLIVDESAMLFHSWDLQEQKKRDRDLFDMLVMSRKLGLDCIFISQHADNISSPLRRISQFDIRCVSTKNIPIIGPTIKRMKGDFLRITRQPETRKEISRTYSRFSLEVGSLYKTEALRGAATQVQRDVTRTVIQTPKTPIWAKVTAAILLVSILGGIWKTKQTITALMAETSEPAASTATQKPGTKNNESSLSQKLGNAIAPPVQGLAYPPPLHPSGPASGHAMQWVEWTPENERIIVSVFRSGTSLTVYTLGGERWLLGSAVEGQIVQEITPFNGAYFAKTDQGTVFYLRPRTYQERRAYDEYIVRLAVENKQKDSQWNMQSTQLPSSSAGALGPQ